MKVHEKVYNYIIKCGINQKVVAEKCNISTTAFCDMLNGKRKMYAEDLRSICYALEVSPEEFIDYREENIRGEDK